MRYGAGVLMILGLFILGGDTYAGVVQENPAARGISVEPLSRDQMASAGFRSPESAGLFIGVREFRDIAGKPADGIAEIPFAVDDAIDLAHLFSVELKLLPPERVTLALSGDPVSAKSKANLTRLMEARVDRVDANLTTLLKQIRVVSRRAGRNGLLVVSVATHGYSLSGDDRLFGRDSALADIELTGIPVRTILDAAAKSNAPRKIVLIDACRERLETGRSLGDPALAMSESFLKALKEAKGVVTLTGATAGGFAYDDDEKQNGVFTSAVIAGLRGEALPDDRGFITTQTLAQYVDASVKEWVKRKRPNAVNRSGIGFITDDMSAGRIPLAVNPVKLKETEQELGQRKELIDVLRRHIDFRIITAQMADEMARVLEEAPAGGASELVHRLAILERIGPAYSPDLAMWWKGEGGKLLARRSNIPPELIEAIGLYTGIVDRVDEKAAHELFEKAAVTDHPIALMWKARNILQHEIGAEGAAEELAVSVIDEIRDLAESENIFAMTLLGEAHLYGGLGVPQSDNDARAWLKRAVRGGDAHAMYLLGEAYRFDAGRPDIYQAIEWYERAAKRGHGDAMNRLGELYLYGEDMGVKLDSEKGMKWRKMAAERGHLTAMYNLGFEYANDQFEFQDLDKALYWWMRVQNIEENPVRSYYIAEAMNKIGDDFISRKDQDLVGGLRWYTLSAEIGNTAAMRTLGFIYLNGLGVGQDYAEAVEWLTMAAELGNVGAMVDLGILHADGLGIRQDFVKAVQWYEKAANLGDMFAAGQLERDGRDESLTKSSKWLW